MKRGRDEGRTAHFDRGVPHTKLAFKMLCTDNFAGALLKDRAAGKEELQTECGARLVFSNQGDYFPSTYFRVMGIYGDEIECIAHMLDRIMPMLAEQADEERDRPTQEGCQLLGKEPGEYVFRLLLSRQMGGLLIGHKGANINKLRAETGAKVFIENDNQLDHRMVRLIGSQQQILACLRNVNGLIEDDCQTEDFQMYAGLVNFNEGLAREGADDNGHGGHSGPARPRPEKRDERRDEKRGRRDGRDGRGRRDGRDKRDGGRDGGRRGASRDRDAERHADAPASYNAGFDAPAQLDASSGLGSSAPLDAVAEVVDSFPPRMQGESFGISCAIPADLVSAVVGRGGEYVREVMEASGTEISAHADGTLQIQGLLVNVYLAHASLMRRVHDAEREKENPQGSAQIIAMKRQVDELQRQLKEMQRG